VEYTQTGGREYYDIDTDPFEVNNIYRRLSPFARIMLHRMVAQLRACQGPDACWAAADPQSSGG
jgi:N-acetylglucosamine-6-sulfatase